jgi:hypothetical protein
MAASVKSFTEWYKRKHPDLDLPRRNNAVLHYLEFKAEYKKRQAATPAQSDDPNRITHAGNVFLVVSMANRPLSHELAIFWVSDFASDFYDASLLHLVACHFSNQFTLGHFSPSTLG